MAVPPSPETNVLLSFDASASVDPDPGDSVAAFAWTFRAVDGQCTPPAVAGTGSLAIVRFACAGRYAVDVTATDQLGARSTATEEFTVAAHAGPALVEVGLDVVVDHLCDATPTCRPSEPVSLSASTPGIAPSGVSFTWTVQPPVNRPLAPHRRVSFSPDASAAAPAVTIETDGEAISGDWIFQVEARDAAGVIGTAPVRVTVQNRPPVVVKTISAPDHAFDGVSFTAGGSVPFTVSDPDGDALVDRTIGSHHAGDGDSTFDAIFEDAPPRVTFSISVPYRAPPDAAKLIGGDGLERSIVFGISDVNGARTTETWAIVVGNQPPFLVNDSAVSTWDHSYDAAANAYLATPSLSTWQDPDGDPIFQVPGSSTGDPVCPEIVVDGTARAQCRLAFTGALTLANFVGPHTVTQAVQDPWAPAETTRTVTFTIGNRTPTVAAAPFDVMCLQGTCCRTSPEGAGCEAYRGVLDGRLTVGNVLPPRWSDPDGDPIQITVDAAGIYTPVPPPPVCVGAACVVQIDAASTSFCGTYGPTLLPTSVTDGVATGTGALSISGLCY